MGKKASKARDKLATLIFLWATPGPGKKKIAKIHFWEKKAGRKLLVSPPPTIFKPGLEKKFFAFAQKWKGMEKKNGWEKAP